MTHNLVTISFIKPARRLIGDIGIQHHNFTALLAGVIFHQVHSKLIPSSTITISPIRSASAY